MSTIDLDACCCIGDDCRSLFGTGTTGSVVAACVCSNGCAPDAAAPFAAFLGLPARDCLIVSSKDFHLNSFLYPSQSTALSLHWTHLGLDSSHFSLSLLHVTQPFRVLLCLGFDTPAFLALLFGVVPRTLFDSPASCCGPCGRFFDSGTLGDSTGDFWRNTLGEGI